MLTPSIAQLAGFVPELAILKAHPRVNIRVHVTKMSESQAEKLATQAAVEDAPRLPSREIEAVKRSDREVATE